MNLFQFDGHLTDEALQALINNTDLPEISRLELSEHLAYCDDCLERYTALLTDGTLLSPQHSCKSGLHRKIWRRKAYVLTRRYATAVAAVVLMIAALWGSLGLSFFGRTNTRNTRSFYPHAVVSHHLEDWPEDWNKAFHDTFSNLNQTLNFSSDAPVLTASKGGSTQ